MIDEALREAEQKMARAVEVAKDGFAAIRTGRAHPAMFANITADYYGQQPHSSSSQAAGVDRRVVGYRCAEERHDGLFVLPRWVWIAPAGG
ncbi:hypothetical protein [Kribbella deserti]|uniref:hypothetical protein n=1 Tax=Kribbella deserti TaxID=1926257 RepID=UPI00406BC680